MQDCHITDGRGRVEERGSPPAGYCLVTSEIPEYSVSSKKTENT
jgi:hypothetical protein